MEIWQYLAPVRRWWWLVVLATALGVASAYYASQDLPPVYMARTSLLVGRGIYDPNPTGNEFGLNQVLSNAYAALALREPVRQGTMAALGLNNLPEFTAKPQANGQLVEITVTDSSPELAQAVANELARQLILQNPTSKTQDSRQQFIDAQLADLQVRIEDTQAEIGTKQAALAEIESAAALQAAQEEIRTLESRYAALQSNYATILASTQQGATNVLSIFEPAALPSVPIGPNKLLIILVAAAGAAVLAVGAAYAIELLDHTFKSSEDIARIVPYPILGYVGEMEKGKAGVYNVVERPRSLTAEAFRSLRTNLEFAGVDQPIKTLLVTSANPGDGKTAVAFNLALVMAQNDKRVIIIDGDLRRPTLHRTAAIPNRDGLSDLFRGHVAVEDVIYPWGDGMLTVITSGNLPPNPTELVGSRKMDQILTSLGERADIVIIDGPPFVVADAWVLASKVDGVLLVVRPGFTHKNAARAMVEQIQRVGARVMGVTLNRTPQAQSRYGRYSYLSHVYMREGAGPRPAASGEGVRGGSRQGLQAMLRSLRRPAEPAAQPPAEVQPPAAERHLEVEVLPAIPSDLPRNGRTRLSLDLMYALSRELAAQVDLSELVRRTLRMTLDTVGATSGSLIVLDENAEVVEAALAYDGEVDSQPAEQLQDVIKQGLAAWVIENRQAAIVPDTREDSRWLHREWDQNGHSQARSAICVPLMSRERVIGVLTLVNPQAGHFTPQDLSMLTAIAVGISFNDTLPASTPAN